MKKALEKCYQATKDGFSARKFHNKLDGTTSFLLVTQTTENQVFGGYTAIQCDSDANGCRSDEKASLFKFDEDVGKNFAVCMTSEQCIIARLVPVLRLDRMI